MSTLDSLDTAVWSMEINESPSRLTLSTGCLKLFGRPEGLRQCDPYVLEEVVHPEDRKRFRKHMDLLAEGESSTIEHRLLLGKDEIKWVRHTGIPLCGPDAQLVRIDGFLQEITSQRAARDQLESKLDMLEKLLDKIDVAIWSYDWTTRLFTFVSEAMRSLTGYPTHWLADARNWPDIIHEDDRVYFTQLEESSRRGIPDLVEFRILHAEGQLRWIQTKIMPLVNELGEVVRVDGVSVDVTERRLAEQERDRSQQRYKSLFDYNSEVICELDLKGEVIDVNPIAEQLTGERIVGESAEFPLEEVFGRDNSQLLVEYFVQTISGHSTQFEVVSRHRNGGEFHWEMKMIPIYVNQCVEGAFVICKDVTARKRVERELRNREAQYRLISDNSMDLMGVLDRNARVLFVSPAFEKVLGYSLDSLHGIEAKQVIHPDDHALLRLELKEIVENKSNRLFRCRMPHVDGHLVTLEASCTPVLGDDGEVENIVVIVRDITEKVKIELELRESEERYRSLIELSPQPMLAHSGGAFLYMNAAGFRLLGADAGAGLAVQTIYDIVHPEDRKAVIRRAKQTAGSKYAGVMEYRIIRQDGQAVEVEATEIYDDFTKTTLTLFTDITERKKMERALQQSEERYRRLVEMSPVAIAVYKEGQIIYLNPAGSRMLGAGEEFETETMLDWVHPDSRENALRKIQDTEANGYAPPGEFQIKHTNGHVIDISLMSIYDSQSDSIQLMFEDITARKRTERALVESEERHFRLQTSLDRFSRDLFGVMKISQMERRLVKEVRDILDATKVRVREEEPNADGLCRVMETERGYSVKLGEVRGKNYVLRIDEKLPLMEITSKKVWLETLARYVSVLFDHFLLIEDLTRELERTASQQVAPTWLLRLLFKLSENERKRLSHDLHDSALQEQIIWYRELDRLTAHEELPVGMRGHIERIAQGLLDVIYQIRLTCNELRPPMLEEGGLISSLEALFAVTQLRTNYRIVFKSDPFFRTLDDDLLLGLYRIIQELLANATKHSFASEVRIALSVQNGRIQLDYGDNGVGMDVRKIDNSFVSMGIYGMKERVRSLNGTIQLYSSHNKGLSILISVPWNE